jgi:RNA polymerase sigma-70 factor (ECF subfamily)
VASRPPEEHPTIEAARRGDRDACARLVRAHEEIAFRTAYLITRNAADAEDAAQEGFVKAFRALGRFRAGSPFRPWLLTIVANEARNRVRASGRRDALALRAGNEALSGDAAPSPERETVARAERTALLDAVDGLPDDQRLAVACRFFLELTENETAAVLGVRPGTVKSRVSRALDRLREEVER